MGFSSEIIAVGTELLLGDVINTNSTYIANNLANFDIALYKHTVVGDNEKRIIDAINKAFEKSDIVITTGGLGPTNDDITKESAAKAFNMELILNEEAISQMEKYLKVSRDEISESNLKQAYFPKEAKILQNGVGTAPGAILEKNNKYIIILPGPPKEMESMFKNCVVPFLKTLSSGIIYSETLRVIGIGESVMAEKVKDLLDNQTNPTIAPYSKDLDAILRITARAKTKEEAKNLILPVKQEIKDILKEDLYAEGETNIFEVVANILREKKYTLSVAESCTGGILASYFTDIPGISSIFLEGIVSYSNEAKIKELNIPKEIIEKYGAVSKEVATLMAKGIKEKTGSDVSIATTGLTGPGGDGVSSDIGQIFVAVTIKDETFASEYHFKGDRKKIKTKGAIIAADFLRRNLK